MNFNEIIKNNSKNIKNIIKKITKEENEDLEQEVYLRLIKNSEKYKEKGKLSNWINTIARNISFDYLKSSKVKNEVLADNETIINNIKDKKDNQITILINKERQKRILDEINNLQPKLKEVIILTEFYGLTYEMCAKKLNCPTGTIKSRIYNAKKELSIRLQDLI